MGAAAARADRAGARRLPGDDALRTSEAIGARFEVGWTRLALAELAHERQQSATAARRLAEARQTFEALHVPRYLDRTERLAMAWNLRGA